MSIVLFTHPTWGHIKVTYTIRAKRITLRGCNDSIHITAPHIARKSDIEKALDMYGEKLLQQRERKHRIIDTTFTIKSDNFKLRVEKHEKENFIMHRVADEFILFCPKETNFPNMQEWLHKVVINILKKEAKRLLPMRLKALAVANGFKYNICNVRDMHTRWGSCNQKGNISLSIYLMLLPDKLMEYVLLHELCHTIEMNHGENFWKQLDKVCNCNAQELRKELKKHSTTI